MDDDAADGAGQQAPVALVTGASRGIGKASALALAEKGFDVGIGARTVHAGEGHDDTRDAPLPGSLDETAAGIEERGQRALLLPMDLHDRASLVAAAEKLASQWGRIDVLVNNAVDTGPGSMDLFVDTDIDTFERKISANYLSQLALIKAVLPGMLARGSGRIINITSASGTMDPPAPAGQGGWGLAYSASKGAFHRVAGVLGVEVGPQGVFAFNVEPGMILTERMVENQRALGLENKYPAAPPSVPASVVAWLASMPQEAADEHNAQTFTAQRVAWQEGLHEDWRASRA
jgi:NAD(P)-dependent dehydrogenase (short-subunit alcohol dehydrogenase family)